MADNEKNTAPVKDDDKESKKVKVKKPSIFKRLGAWLKTVWAERKKITWASWESVKSNSFVVIVITVITAAVLGLLDYLVSNAIIGLSRII